MRAEQDAAASVGIAVTEGIDRYEAIEHAAQSVIDLPGDFVNSLAHGLDSLSDI